MTQFKNILFQYLPSVKSLYRWLYYKRCTWLLKHNPQKLAALYYKNSMGQKLDWKNPKDLNAKIQWLKFYGDRELWARCSDKYAVREYVESRGLKSILVDLYGKWDSVDDINFSSLPEQFIIKMNTGSGGNFICRDKSKLDEKKVKDFFTHWFNTEYSDMFVEPHYQLIKPCIIAEELLNPKKQDLDSTTLIDYKVWAFNGKPLYIWVCHNRKAEEVQVATYDLNWNYRPELSVFNSVFKESSCAIPRPTCLTQMIEAAAILSKGHPEVRVDFYVVDGVLYFGEMTFTSLGGYMDFYSKEMLMEMGDNTDLTIVNKK